MSDNSQTIVDVEARADEARRLADELRCWLVAEGIVQAAPSNCILGEGQGYAPGPDFHAALAEHQADEGFLTLATNGVRVASGRQVFDTGGNGIELTCHACGSTFEPGTEWMNVVSEWSEGNDDALYSCPTCNKKQRLSEWRGPWAWGFGHLGLEFWNWPPLSDAFLRAVERKLGHRSVLVRCHL